MSKLDSIENTTAVGVDKLEVTAHKADGTDIGITYELLGGRIYKEGEAITADNVHVEKLRFYIKNEPATAQPRVTVSIKIRHKDSATKAEEQHSIELQTTVSSRSYSG